MSEFNSFNSRINESINNLFKEALHISLKNPSQALFLLKTIKWQKEAARVRADNEYKGLHVPPFMIASITKRCNLKCKGCYFKAQDRNQEVEMSMEKLKDVFSEARELGISIILIAGGEPLVRQEEILDLISQFPEIIFPLFTNGMLLNEDTLEKLKHRKNIIPVISIEGFEEDTDRRRGDGVYEYLTNIFRKMDQKGIFYGTSITLTRSNYDAVTDESFVRGLVGEGSKLFFYVEYVPMKEGTEDWVLTENQARSVSNRMDRLRENFQSLFIAFPGDEEALGGCLAAGRGFLHISPGGNLEPCPFAPFSDTNLNEKTLEEALKSDFLKIIRQNHSLLVEGQGGCALWEKRDWVQSLLKPLA
ncbi:MAG: radical SAM protein [Clostridia bacterium]|nr:radical SAM protein [Clostridia bacterium]